MKKLILIILIMIVLFSCTSIRIPEPEHESDSLIIGSLIWDFPDGFFNQTPRTLQNNIKLTFVNETTSKQVEVRTKNGYFYFLCKYNDKFILQDLNYKGPDPGRKSTISCKLDLQIPVDMHKIIYLGQIKLIYSKPEIVKSKDGSGVIMTYWNFKTEYKNENKIADLKKYIAKNDSENLWQGYKIMYLFEK